VGQRHSGEAKGILAQRGGPRASKQRHPERWSNDIRAFNLPNVVHLDSELESAPQAAEL
tara:strand:+ start:1132 stop:1308 length:177 start_codon:yes stop_codon:yes gene_type:complete